MSTSLFNTNSSTSGTSGTSGTSSSATDAVTATSVASSASSQMFTKLLVAQIKNQDPLSPSDPSQFVNQLTQLSQTEALQSLTSMTSSSASALHSMQVLALGAQVGSNLMASATSVKLGSAKVDGQITLAAASTSTTLTLTGTDGQAHTLALGTLAAGTAAFSIDPSALGLAAGSYQMKVQTSTSETPAIDIAGKLNSVRLSASGNIMLNIANLGEVDPATLTGFNGTTAASSTL